MFMYLSEVCGESQLENVGLHLWRHYRALFRATLRIIGRVRCRQPGDKQIRRFCEQANLSIAWSPQLRRRESAIISHLGTWPWRRLCSVGKPAFGIARSGAERCDSDEQLLAEVCVHVRTTEPARSLRVMLAETQERIVAEVASKLLPY